ncbi:hypothetical protein BDN72DRAFT_446427 [Pluteus cervinus]|uniref:Uncharacterized protein n=1 Tax=Pluteus cervinus TaxID=181527 RepID=A0ACD3BD88_9AGAR|nr:hypothetical protein BDN72DRAFT_446427 [Pluteus cervinus]
MSPSHTLLSIIASAVSKLDIHPRRVWNGKLPIAYLPSEILILIFLCAQDAALPRQKGHTALALSWVSHHWRVVALSSQDLWGTIDFRNPEWARASLSRSGVSPLSIFLKETREELTPTLTLILTEHFRVKTLRLEAQLPGFQRIPLDELWSQPTPHMTDLLLDNFIIPDGHLISTAPALRHLELRACVFDVSGLHGFNLVKLSL